MIRLVRLLVLLGLIAIIIPVMFSSLIGAYSSLPDTLVPEILAAPGDPVVDNSASPAFPPIGNQGSLSSCVGWATTYYQLTYENALARGLNAAGGNANVIFSPKWTYNMINDGSNGNTTLEDAYALLAKNGAATLASFPYDTNYQAWCLNPAAWLAAIRYRATVTTVSGSLEAIKAQLATNHVLVFTTYVQSWVQETIGNDPATRADDAFTGQYIASYMNNSQNDLHSMTLVGYNDNIWVDLNGDGTVSAGEKGAFKVANSRGTGDWNRGYRWVSYDALRSASIAPATSTWPPSDRDSRGIFLGQAYRLTVNNSYSPTMVAEVTLNTRFRDQIAVSLGVGSAGAAAPSATWTSAAVNYSGGPYAFDGSITARDGTFYFDYTDIASRAPAQARWFVGISNNGNNTAAIKSFRLFKGGTAVATSNRTPVTVANGQTWVGIDYSTTAPTPTPTQYTLTTTTAGSGSITKTPNKAYYSAGESVQLRAAPTTGWRFQGWSGDLSGTTNPINVAMNANKNIRATFVQTSPTTTAPPVVPPPTGGGVIYIPPVPPSQVTVSVTGVNPAVNIITSPSGVVQNNVQLKIEDGKGSLGISQGTTLLGANGLPLNVVAISIPKTPPSPPENQALIVDYELGPEGAKFDKPVTLAVNYVSSILPVGANESDLYLAYREGDKWTKLDSQVNILDKIVSTNINHFSQYALLIKVPPAKPASFVYSSLIVTPAEVSPDVAVIIQTNVSNNGGMTGICTVILKINGAQENKMDISLAPGKTANAKFEIKKSSPGNYTIDVNGNTGSFAVVAVTPEKTVVPTPAQAAIPSPAVISVPTREPTAVAVSLPTQTSQAAEPTSKVTIPLKWVVVGLAVIAVLIWLVTAIRTHRK